MKLTVVEDANGVTRLVLDGKMDIEGAMSVDKEFGEIAASRKKLAVDLSHVDFLASLGMRTLVSNAKLMMKNGGRMVLFGAQPTVERRCE